MRVPLDLRVRVGLLEVRRSLCVHTLSTASRLALKYAARVLEAFEAMRTHNLSKEECNGLIAACFVDLGRKVDWGFIPHSDRPDFEIEEQRGLALERISDLQGQMETNEYDGRVINNAVALSDTRGLDFQVQDGMVRDAMLNGVARAMIESQRLFAFRLDERLATYTPHDPFFVEAWKKATGPESHATGEMAATFPQPHDIGAIGATVGELSERYLKSKKASWAAKTYRSRERQMAYVVEFFGEDTRANAITPTQVRDFRDALCRLRVNHHVGAGKSFASRQTESLEGRIAGKTADLLFEVVKAFFRWAKGDAYLANNPADGIPNAPHPKTKAKVKARRGFTGDELGKLFSSPLYTGCAGLRRRHLAGNQIISDACYWIPLVAHYGGLRLGEIVQLQFADVHADAAIPFLKVTEEGGGAEGSGEEKYIKSEAGVRIVPLHPDLMSLGFGQFVKRRKKQRGNAGRLFFEIGYGADGMPSTLFSKRFARFLDRIGLTDSALVFHSFRHNMEDAFRNAKVHQYIIDRVILRAGSCGAT